MGLKKTLARIAERFAWKGMTEDVKRIVSPYKHSILIYSYLCTCDQCQRVNSKLTTTTPELHPVPVQSPWFHVGIDFVGPVTPKSVHGNRYILTLSDYFTKWVEAVPLPTKEAPGVAKSLLKVHV